MKKRIIYVIHALAYHSLPVVSFISLFFDLLAKFVSMTLFFPFFLSELRSQGIDMSSREIVEMVSKLSVVCLNASLAVSFYSVFWYTKTRHLKQSRRLKSSPAIPHLTSILKVCTIPDPGDNREYTSHENLEEESVSEANDLSAAGFVTESAD